MYIHTITSILIFQFIDPTNVKLTLHRITSKSEKSEEVHTITSTLIFQFIDRTQGISRSRSRWIKSV